MADSGRCDSFESHVANTTDYLLYIPGAIVGVILCLFGFQLSRNLRFLFGFCMAFYGMSVVMDAASQTVLLQYIFAALCGGVVALLMQKYHRLGTLAMGLTFGMCLGFVVVVVGLQELWCGAEHSTTYFYATLGVCSAAMGALNHFTTIKRRRKHLIIMDTAFVGSFVVIQSFDIFFGDYWSFGDVADCDCKAVRSTARYMVIALFGGTMIGWFVQAWLFRRSRARLNNNERILEMYQV